MSYPGPSFTLKRREGTEVVEGPPSTDFEIRPEEKEYPIEWVSKSEEF